MLMPESVPPKKFEIENAAARLARFRAAANATVSQTKALASWAANHDHHHNTVAEKAKASVSIPLTTTTSGSRSGSDREGGGKKGRALAPPSLQIPGLLLSGSRSQPSAFIHNVRTTTPVGNSSPVSTSVQQDESPLPGSAPSPEFSVVLQTNNSRAAASTTVTPGIATTANASLFNPSSSRNAAVPNAAFTASRAMFNSNSVVSRPLGTAPGGLQGTAPVVPPPILPRSRRRDV